MWETLRSVIAAADDADPANRILHRYLAAVLIVSCGACMIPIELFLIEVWPRYGFASLLLVIYRVLGRGRITPMATASLDDFG